MVRRLRIMYYGNHDLDEIQILIEDVFEWLYTKLFSRPNEQFASFSLFVVPDVVCIGIATRRLLRLGTIDAN